jgi:hypothetical protein
MRHLVPSPCLLVPVLLLGLAASGLTACSRTDDRASDPAAGAGPAASTSQDAAPAAGGPTTLKPGLWKTVTKTPAGPQDSTQCVGEGYDPGAEAASKVSPCGKPQMTRTADGFRLDLACQKNHIDYVLTGTVRGDFVTTADTELKLVVSAFGRRQTLQASAVSTYQGPCEPGAQIAGQNAGKTAAQ